MMNAQTSECDLMEALFQEMQHLRNEEVGFRFDLTPNMAFAVVAMLQLALRHPGTEGSPAELAKNFIEMAKSKFAPYPALTEVLRRGDRDCVPVLVPRKQPDVLN